MDSVTKGSMSTYKVGYFVGSLSSASINRELAKALIRVAPEELEFTEIPIGNLPLYSPDYDKEFPPEAREQKEAIAASDAVLIVSPEYNRSIPSAEECARLGVTALGAKLSRANACRCRRGIRRSDRDSFGATEPARRAQLLQRPADDRP